MEQPITLRWQSEQRYCSAMLTPDLFGGWTLVTSSGMRDGRDGRVQQKRVDNYEKGLESLRRLRKRRRHEGYALCNGGFAEFERLDPRGRDMRAAKRDALARLFDLWQLTGAEQATLLGIDAATLDSYLDGRPLADDTVLLSRADHLLAINKVLRRRYGTARGFAAEWLRLPNAGLDGRRPLELMLASRQDLAGLRRHLDETAPIACPRGSATGR